MTVGVLGCMAERLKEKLLDQEKLVDIVVGPDAYRDLPKLVKEIEDGKKGINVFLLLEETYADISPIRLSGNGVTALSQLQEDVIICVLFVLFHILEEEKEVVIQKVLLKSVKN